MGAVIGFVVLGFLLGVGLELAVTVIKSGEQ